MSLASAFKLSGNVSKMEYEIEYVNFSFVSSGIDLGRYPVYSKAYFKEFWLLGQSDESRRK